MRAAVRAKAHDVADWEANAARALLLLIAANATPVGVARVLGRRGAAPVDCGLTLPDGNRLFGSHKTWRGLASGTAACTLVARLLGSSWKLGAAFGLLALVGDLVSSSVKRRLRLTPGREVPLIDQLPETLPPLLVFAQPLELDVGTVIIVTAVFTVLDIATARLRHLERGR